MSSLKMSHDSELGQRSTGCKITRYLAKHSFLCHLLPIKHLIYFTEIIQNVMEILVVFNT